MKNIFITIFVFVPVLVYTQSGNTFEIEELTRPDKGLRVSCTEDIFKELILSDTDFSIRDAKTMDIPFNIIAQGAAADSLINYGYHSFFNGMFRAYADHRPFVLSPDMIWLLVSQGFAHHVNANSEKLRKQFVQFEGKIDLIVRNDSITLKNPDSPWESVFPEFEKKIAEYVGSDLTSALSCDFSTTSATSKIASQITIMEAMKSYFDFVVVSFACGIPEITLEGTTGDWQKVLEKAKYLRKFDLDWWIDEIEPLLKNFVKASQGNVDKTFWRNMFKYHSKEEYGSPEIIDGWIVKFFPYDKEGKRNSLKEIMDTDRLPHEMVKVDLKFVELLNGIAETTELELWAGFIGLEQNPVSYALKPQIGWMIRKKDVGNLILIEKFKLDNSKRGGGMIDIRVERFPEELLLLPEINKLRISYVDEINIPDEIHAVVIKSLMLSGKISREGIARIRKLLPGTKLYINGKIIESN